MTPWGAFKLIHISSLTTAHSQSSLTATFPANFSNVFVLALEMPIEHVKNQCQSPKALCMAISLRDVVLSCNSVMMV